MTTAGPARPCSMITSPRGCWLCTCCSPDSFVGSVVYMFVYPCRIATRLQERKHYSYPCRCSVLMHGIFPITFFISRRLSSVQSDHTGNCEKILCPAIFRHCANLSPLRHACLAFTHHPFSSVLRHALRMREMNPYSIVQGLMILSRAVCATHPGDITNPANGEVICLAVMLILYIFASTGNRYEHLSRTIRQHVSRQEWYHVPTDVAVTVAPTLKRASVANTMRSRQYNTESCNYDRNVCTQCLDYLIEIHRNG